MGAPPGPQEGAPEPVLPEDDGYEEEPPGPLFQPSLDFPDAIDRARLPGQAIRQHLTTVNRIAGGCKVIAELLSQEASDDPHRNPGEPDSPPVILGHFHRGQLYLLLSACMETLATGANCMAVWAYEYHTEEGQQEVAARVPKVRPVATVESPAD